MNGRRADNRIENLSVLTAREHGLLHHPPQLPVQKTCVVCAAVFIPHKTKRRRQQTCGPTCKAALLTRLNQTRKVADADVARIRAGRAEGIRLAVLARQFGITEQQVCAIALRRSRA